MAGLRTIALVSLGSTLFVLMGAFAFGAGDPTRVAAQVASWIGFLGAGVMLDDERCVTMITEFIAGNPELWNEDIGVAET